MKYIVKGNVRGIISYHNKLSTAIRSMKRDQKMCRRIGGGAYSDVRIIREDGEDFNQSEWEEIRKADQMW